MSSGRTFKYLILGGGNAAGYAAQEYVALGGKKGDLCIVSAEGALPYERPALSKGYLNPSSPARLPGFHTCVGAGGERQAEDWYANHEITFLGNTRVTKAQLQSKILETETHGTIGFETLIIATGARVKQLNDFGCETVGLKNVFTLRDIADADALYQAMQANTGKTAVVVGGGYIGLECTAALRKHDIKVKMIYPSEHLMPRLFTAPIATFYETYYLQQQVELLSNSRVVQIESTQDQIATNVVLQDGTKIFADMIVVGVGANPNVELFQEELEMQDGGIKVNGKLQTSMENVYAIGDIASFPFGNGYARLEHVDNARKTAAHAIQAILNPSFEKSYEYLPYFYSRVFDLSWKFYGESNGECISFTHGTAGSPGAYWVKDGKVTGAFLESGSDEQFEAIRKVAATKPDATGSETGIDFALSKL